MTASPHSTDSPRGPGRARDEAGVAFPSPLVLLSIVAVAMAGIAFVTTMPSDEGGEMTSVSQPSESASEPTPSEPASPQAKKTKKPKPPAVNKAKTYVEVYNNSGIAGLAGSTGAEASGAGWNVVAADNWYGTVPASTVYYPERLQAAAKMLAQDLGIRRLMPAVDPMRLDRLTVILTSDYS